MANTIHNSNNLRENPRYIAIQLLKSVLQGASLTEQMPLQTELLSDQNRRLTQHLLFGLLRIYDELADRVRQMLKTPIKSNEIEVELALILGAYELTEMATADHATINNWVELLRSMNKPWAVGLANAILRNIQRGKLPPAKTLSGKMNLPEWMVHRLNDNWGRDATETITAFFRLHPEMIIRFNQGKGSREDYLARLTQAEINATAHQFVSSAIVLDEPVNVDRLPGFFEGDASVQDASAQLASQFLKINENDRVLDACSAPGGKTTGLLEKMPNVAQLVALDQSEARLAYVADNIKRLFGGEIPHNVTLMASRAEEYQSDEAFDKILLDVPCSGTGIMHRNPDIKRLRKSTDIRQLVATQRSILNHAWSLLKPGGQLLYSTCSIFKAENSDQIERFLKEQSSAKLIPLEWPNAHHNEMGTQILPLYLSANESMDGFFYALLEKKPI